MISTLALALLAAMPQAECEYTADRSATVAASRSDVLAVVARAGSLRVEGRPGLQEVRVRGRACASSRDLLDQLVVQTGRAGGRVRVEVPEIETSGIRFWEDRRAELDLVIEVPEGMEAEIEDGSGEIEIRGIGGLRLDDGSGEIHLENIGGDLDLEDGSGEIRIFGVAGNVSIDDGSGEIEIRDVRGSVTIDDGSGSIDVADVTGDLTVSDDGSGSITYRNVRGRVDVPQRHRRRRGPER